MASVKTEGYSAEQTAKIVDMYLGGRGASVEDIAAAIGKTAKSVIAKLSKEGVYVSATKAKTKTRKATKSELVVQVANSLGLAPSVIESLEKATHEALEALVANVETLAKEASHTEASE